MKTTVCTVIKFTLFLLLLDLPQAHAQTSSFTYQGRLNESGSVANGFYDFRVVLYDSETGGIQQGQVLTNNTVSVTNGLFSLPLDFGSNVFTGADRWLQIAVRSSTSGGDYTLLQPRQQITSNPYAIQSANAVTSITASSLSGTIVPANITAGMIDSTMLANNSVTAAALSSNWQSANTEAILSRQAGSMNLSNWTGIATNMFYQIGSNTTEIVAHKMRIAEMEESVATINLNPTNWTIPDATLAARIPTNLMHVVNVMEYGATDGGADDTAAFLAAAAVVSSKGGIFFMPAGNYTINQTISFTGPSIGGSYLPASLSGHFEVRGDGKTKITYNGTAAALKFTWAQRGVKLSGFTLVGTNISPSIESIGILLEGPNGGISIDVNIFGFKCGILGNDITGLRVGKNSLSWIGSNYIGIAAAYKADDWDIGARIQGNTYGIFIGYKNSTYYRTLEPGAFRVDGINAYNDVGILVGRRDSKVSIENVYAEGNRIAFQAGYNLARSEESNYSADAGLVELSFKNITMNSSQAGVRVYQDSDLRFHSPGHLLYGGTNTSFVQLESSTAQSSTVYSDYAVRVRNLAGKDLLVNSGASFIDGTLVTNLTSANTSVNERQAGSLNLTNWSALTTNQFFQISSNVAAIATISTRVADAGASTTNYIHTETMALQDEFNLRFIDEMAAKQGVSGKLTSFSALADEAGVLANDGLGNYSWIPTETSSQALDQSRALQEQLISNNATISDLKKRIETLEQLLLTKEENE